MHQIYPADGPAAEQDADRREPAGFLAASYPYPQPRGDGRPWVRANMIASADGAAELGGRSGGLGGPADRLLFRVLRGLADVILVGSGTARAEGYGPARPDATLSALRAGQATQAIAVLTASLSLDPESPLLSQAPADARTIVLTTESAPDERRAAIARRADVIVAGADQVSAAQAVTALAGLGYARILVEGGPSLLAQIAAEGLLDELCLTISPVLAGGRSRRILDGGPGGRGVPEPLSLRHVLADDGYLFCRYVRREE